MRALRINSVQKTVLQGNAPGGGRPAASPPALPRGPYTSPGSRRGGWGVGFCLTSWNDSFIPLLSIKPTGLARTFQSSQNSVLYKINWIRWRLIHLHQTQQKSCFARSTCCPLSRERLLLKNAGSHSGQKQTSPKRAGRTPDPAPTPTCGRPPPSSGHWQVIKPLSTQPSLLARPHRCQQCPSSYSGRRFCLTPHLSSWLPLLLILRV